MTDTLIDDIEINPHKCTELIFVKGTKVIQRKKGSILINYLKINFHRQINEFDLNFTPHKKLTQNELNIYIFKI